MIAIWIMVACALCAMTGILAANMVTFPRLRAATPAHAPCVSVLVPARNEAAVIAATVQRLRALNYPDFEIVILDDDSDDGTTQIAQQAASGDPRVRVISGAPLPEGWLGKNWACHQLAEAATGDILVFTDADVQWESGALAAITEKFAQHHADALTVWPTQITHTWAERLTVPLMALVVWAYLPEFLVRRAPFAVFAAANGQCLAFRREAYTHTGGHAGVHSAIVEDVALARAVKRAGLRIVMADGNDLVRCRMYDGWASVRDGYAKNIIAGHGGVVPLLLSTVFHWLVFAAPWLWLLLGAVIDLGPDWPVFPLLLVVLGLGLRAVSAITTRQRARDALWMPVSVLLMTLITVRSLRWHYTGGPRWKGRIIENAASGETRAPATKHGRTA